MLSLRTDVSSHFYVLSRQCYLQHNDMCMHAGMPTQHVASGIVPYF
jgi:hypothetical protein